jgi:hypothetical protein
MLLALHFACMPIAVRVGARGRRAVLAVIWQRISGQVLRLCETQQYGLKPTVPTHLAAKTGRIPFIKRRVKNS